MRQLKLNFIAVAVGLALGTTAFAQNLSKSDYSQATDRIASDLRAASASCGSMSGNSKDICMAQAKGVDHVALADLENRYKPTNNTRYNVRAARAEADYAVAKERCDDSAGNAKDVCVKEAKAIEVAALAEAKTQITTADAKKTANEQAATVRNQGKELPTARSGNRIGPTALISTLPPDHNPQFYLSPYPANIGVA